MSGSQAVSRTAPVVLLNRLPVSGRRTVNFNRLEDETIALLPRPGVEDVKAFLNKSSRTSDRQILMRLDEKGGLNKQEVEALSKPAQFFKRLSAKHAAINVGQHLRDSKKYFDALDRVIDGRSEEDVGQLPAVYSQSQLFPNADVAFARLIWADENGYFDIVRSLLNHPDISKVYTAKGLNALEAAIKKKQLSLIKIFLASPDAEKYFRHRNSTGQSLLHLAVQTRNQNIVEVLLKHPKMTPEFLNAEDLGGRTAFHIAVMSGGCEVVEEILQSPHMTRQLMAVQDLDRDTALHYATCKPSQETAKRLLQHASMSDAVALATDSNGKTIGDIAVEQGHLGLLDLLPNREAVWNKKNDQGQTIFHQTILHGTVQQIDQMLYHPYMTREFLSIRDSQGQTALHLAAMKGNVEVLEMLLTHGCMSSHLACFKDRCGKTARQLFNGRGLREGLFPEEHREQVAVTELQVIQRFEEARQFVVQQINSQPIPAMLHSGLHYEQVAVIFNPDEPDPIYFYPVLSDTEKFKDHFIPGDRKAIRQEKRLNQVRVFGQNLAFKLNAFREAGETNFQKKTIYQEARFEIEFRRSQAGYELFAISLENLYGVEEKRIFSFRNLAEPRLQYFMSALHGGPVGVVIRQ